MASGFGLMAVHTKATGKTGKCAIKELTNGLTVLLMKANGCKTKCMEREEWNGPTVAPTPEISSKINGKATENTCSQMEVATKENS